MSAIAPRRDLHTRAQPTRFYGKFRGVVARNDDPDNLGRVQASVPDVYGEGQSGWALPALPYAGDDVGCYLVPPTGALVWIEFERGDTSRPIWSGCFWGRGQLPSEASGPDVKVLKTVGCTLSMSDSDGSTSITIEMGSNKIVLDSSGVTIDAGDAAIDLSGLTRVTINDGALEVR